MDSENENKEAREKFEAAIKEYVEAVKNYEGPTVITDYFIIAAHVSVDVDSTNYTLEWNRRVAPHALEGLIRKGLRWTNEEYSQ